jgi:HEPN domain-containing protein
MNTTFKEKIGLWQESATQDRDFATHLYEVKKYHYCLFFCHLALEKIIKALFIKNKDTYPLYSHNLVKLCVKGDIKISEEQEEQMAEITTFNIEARYDIYKEALYKKATKKYALKYLNYTKELFNYFNSLL